MVFVERGHSVDITTAGGALRIADDRGKPYSGNQAGEAARNGLAHGQQAAS